MKAGNYRFANKLTVVMLKKEEIVKILSELLAQKGIHVSKIVIFGSFAKGKLRKDSDIDLIVVSKDFRNKSIFERAEAVSGIGWEIVNKTRMPFDILYYSDDEWEKGNLIINAAKEQGEIVYS